MNTQLFSFKNPNYKTLSAGGRPKVYKSVKQIQTLERNRKWPEEVPLYYRVNAPPSFVPAKKYSDISGLASNYKDPHTKLHFFNTDEYNTIQSLPSDIVSGYLQLRGHSFHIS